VGDFTARELVPFPVAPTSAFVFAACQIEIPNYGLTATIFNEHADPV
jgi:hypothetical protein